MTPNVNSTEFPVPSDLIDMHVHVGVPGDGQFAGLARFRADYMEEFVFQVFLLYAGVKKQDVTDSHLFEVIVEKIRQSKMPKVVCLALDHYFDPVSGAPDPGQSLMWVSNQFVVEHLRPALPDRILFGASVNPNDRANFESRVQWCVEHDAVLMKWIPSAQGINLADLHVGQAMKFLASAGKNGKPLPLLLHVGPEHSIPPPNKNGKLKSLDYLSWNFWDRLFNLFGSVQKPNVNGIRANIEAALQAGAQIIFAHCGTPFYNLPGIRGLSEHSDFDTVVDYLRRTNQGEFVGKCYADISAFVTPFRKPYIEKLGDLPPQLLLFGSDFPVTVVELSAGPEEWWDDLYHIITEGDLKRVIVPEDNLFDVNFRELRIALGDHPVFTNAKGVLLGG